MSLRQLKDYRVGKVVGDRYGGEWPRERFRVHGVSYDLAEKPKSDIYRDAFPGLNSGKFELLDHSRLVAQIAGLSGGRRAGVETASIILRVRMRVRMTIWRTLRLLRCCLLDLVASDDRHGR